MKPFLTPKTELRWILIIAIFSMNYLSLKSQSFPCGTEYDNGDEPMVNTSDCASEVDALSMKCVRIKFHVINNTSNQTQDLPDYFILQLLEKVNAIYGNTKLKFSLENNCTHRATLSGIDTDQDFRSKIGDITPGNFNPDPDLAWDPNAINVFVFQNSIFNRPYHSGKYYPWIYLGEFGSVKAGGGTLAHELGHALSLKHTFGNGDPSTGIIAAQSNWECKDGSNSETTGDYITDTGADPATQDLIAPFNVIDPLRSCYDNPPASLKDICQDDQTPWDIPFDNVMSYYSCGAVLTACQTG